MGYLGLNFLVIYLHNPNLPNTVGRMWCLCAKNRHLFWNSDHQPIKSIVFELFESLAKCASRRGKSYMKMTSWLTTVLNIL